MIKKIKQLKGLESGKDIYILANAPSVKEFNLSKLKDKVTIGMNANPLLEREFGFISDYYVVSDQRFLKHPIKRKMAIEMLHPSTKRVFKSALKDCDSGSEIENKTYYVRTIGKNGFSFDLRKGYYFGSTTTMLAIQLAFYLGAKNIYILGVDLKYNGINPRFYIEDVVQEYDHAISVQIYNIRNAFLQLKKKGVGLFNCSKLSLIAPYIPYKNLKELL
jgi:hypothetical protein